MALTKADIIRIIAEQNGYTQFKAALTFETLLEIMKRTLESGEDVMISGFGKFTVNNKAARRGRNPATGEQMMLPPRRVVTFKVSGKLRDRVNERR